MANAHSFPLLRLPLLAAIKGIQLMNVREQFKLSKLSKRSRCIVRSSVKKQRIQLELEFKKRFPITIKNFTATNEYRFNLLPFGEYPDVELVKQFVVHMAATFSILSIHLDCSEAPNPRYLFDLVPLWKNLNLTLAFIAVSGGYQDNGLCRFIFKECNNFKRVEMFCTTSTDFEIIPEQIQEFHSDQFAINKSWFTMNHVLKSFMNCKKLELFLPFSATDLNAFLQNWIQGCGVLFLRCVIVGDTGMQKILNGITAVPKPEVLISFDGYGTTPYSECFIIEQSNGTKGVVSVLEDKYFYLSTVFELENGEKYGNYKEEVYSGTEIDNERTQPSLCTPMKNSTFFFAYSNDLDNSTVLGALKEAVAFNMWGLQNRYKFTANVRIDTKIEEEIQYHDNNPFFFNTSVMSLLPDPALGYGDSTTGSNVFNFVQKFLSNKQIPICGSALFIMMKRYPSETDISPLISQLRANNVYVYIIAPEVPNGGNSPHLLYEMSSKTNGFCTFVNEKSYTAVAEESLMFMERPFQFMSKKYVVSGSGRIEIPSFITPIPYFMGDQVMAQLTVQDHVVDNNFISLNYTITGVRDGNVAHKFPRDDYFGRQGSGIVDDMILNGTVYYKLTLDYKYASNEQQIIELRMYNQYYHDFPPLSG